MLSKSPYSTPATTFALVGDARVKLAADFKCPHCGRGLHAADVDIDHSADVGLSIRLICGGAGCHRDLLIITEDTSTEETP